jgi:NAD(P)-dependent dehydrogenase (short-subunit alcohol dehydrogenase family)
MQVGFHWLGELSSVRENGRVIATIALAYHVGNLESERKADHAARQGHSHHRGHRRDRRGDCARTRKRRGQGHARRPPSDRLEALADEICARGSEALTRRLDVTVRDDVAGFADAARHAFGRVDVNIKGVLYGIAAVLPEMIAHGAGHMARAM